MEQGGKNKRKSKPAQMFESGEQSLSAFELRKEFLAAIPKYLPEVMDDLAGGPYTHFLNCGLGSVDYYDFKRQYAHCLAGGTRQPQTSSSVIEFAQGVDNWLNKYNLNAEWAFEEVYLVMRYWALDPGSFQAREWKDHGCRPVQNHPPILKPPLGLPYYNISIEKRDEYLERLQERIFEALSHDLLSHVDKSFRSAAENQIRAAAVSYCDEYAIAVRTDGFKPVKSRRNSCRDIEWAVLFQVGNKEINEIKNKFFPKLCCEDSKKASTRVRKAVDRLLNLIALPKRTAVKGRPPTATRGRK